MAALAISREVAGRPWTSILLSVADPRYPRWGRQLWRDRQPIIWPNFAENAMKMKHIGPGAAKILLYGSATDYI